MKQITVADLEKLYITEGLSVSAVGVHLGLSPKTVSQRLHAAGIPVRGHGHRAGRPRHDLDRDTIGAMYAAGLTLAEIAVEHRCSPAAIRARLTARGVPIRSTWESIQLRKARVSE